MNFYFLSILGIDGPDADAALVKAPYQKGKTRVGTNIEERVVTVEACLVAHSEGQTETVAELERLRRQLIHTMNPLQNGRLEIYGDTFVKQFTDVQVAAGPTFKDEDYNAPDGILFFSFTLVVPGNFLEDLEQIMFDLVEVVPAFEFILEFEGVQGQTEEKQVQGTIIFGDMTQGGVNVLNDGDVEAPVIIEIPGPVETPSVTNNTTGEFIRVNTPILAGETMFINTAFGKKSVIIRDENGGERNAFHYLEVSSTFFQLPVGTSNLRFMAEVGNDTASVRIHIKRLYLGV